MKIYIGLALALTLLSSVAKADPSGCYDPAIENDIGDNFPAYQIDVSGSGITCSLPTGGSRSETQAFVGLTFSAMGGKVYHKVSAGIRQIDVQPDDSVSGAEINVSSSLTELGKDTTAHILALNGNRSQLSNVGVGFNFEKSDWLLNVGLQLPYVRVYGDYMIKEKVFIPSIELNSYGKIDPVVSTCNGVEVTSDQLLQTLVDQQVLNYDGVALRVISGDIYSGVVEDFENGDYDWTFTGVKNASVYNGSDKTCLSLASDANANLD